MRGAISDSDKKHYCRRVGGNFASSQVEIGFGIFAPVTLISSSCCGAGGGGFGVPATGAGTGAVAVGSADLETEAAVDFFIGPCSGCCFGRRF